MARTGPATVRRDPAYQGSAVTEGPRYTCARARGSYLGGMALRTASVHPTARADVLLRRVGSEWVLFDARRDRAHVLNLTAALVWTYCDGMHGPDAIAGALEREVEGAQAEAILGDIDGVLRRFAEEGLLQ